MKMLGTTEELILLAIVALAPNGADAKSIGNLLKTNVGKVILPGALYSTINRLLAKKIISQETTCGEKAMKSIYQVTGYGRDRLKINKTARQSLGG